MRNIIIKIAFLGGLATGLTGCASWFDGGPQHVPTPLMAIQATQNPIVKWGVSQAKSQAGFAAAYSEGMVYSADEAGTIRGIDVLSGKVVSSVGIKQHLTTGVGVYGDLAFVGTDDAKLLAVDQKTGKIAWQQPLTSLMLESPQVLADMVVVKTNDGRLTGFSAKEGKQEWTISTTLPPLIVRNYASMTSVEQDVLIVGQAGGGLIILNPRNGTVLWQGVVSTPHGATELERVTDIVSRPIFDHGQVCAVAYQGRLACFDAHSGNQMWSFDVSSSRGLAVDDQHIYVIDEQGVPMALDRKTGKLIWKNTDLKYRDLSGPAMLNDTVMIADAEGYVHLLSTQNGHFVGRLKTTALMTASQPVSFGSSILLHGQDGRLILIGLDKTE